MHYHLLLSNEVCETSITNLLLVTWIANLNAQTKLKNWKYLNELHEFLFRSWFFYVGVESSLQSIRSKL
jgi:hypothetical protein